ncbi:hemicentin-1-like [Uloborus diversus]|uniref:hemicentin-1-like n=1 Tax=Uloborus diversus TaxID=327109 RepID=UPI0024098F1C|nr:hemicentin-1-like [Uloborus diversus]
MNQSGLEIQPFFFPQTISEGERVIVACTTKSGSKSGDPLSFKWLKDGNPLQSKIQVKTFADFSNMVIDSVTEEDSGNYTCAVSSSGFHDTFSAPLVVMVPPQWLSIPMDSNSFAGEFLVINCRASGKPQPTVTWTKSEGSGREGFLPLSPNDHLLLPANGSLIITQVKKHDEGLYQCVATNSVGQSLKKIVSVYVSVMESNYLLHLLQASIIAAVVNAIIEHPKIQAFNFPVDVIVGQKASAMCTAISGMPPLDFRWLKNGKELSPGGKITIRTLVDVSVLVIESVDASSSGNYTCHLRTSTSSDSYTAHLDVKEPSSWTNKVHDHDLKAGENATILCEATGLPLPQVTWKKKIDNGQEISASVEQQTQLPGSSKLLLLNTKPEDSSYYSCEASNNVGDIISRTIYINVLDATSLRIPPFSFPAESIIGRRVSATCTPSFGEKIEFKWLKNGKEILKGLNVDIRSFSDLSTLVIDPLREEDTGNYTCIVNTRGMSGSYTTTLEVLVPPSWTHTPNDVDALSGDTITMNCMGNGRPNPTTTWSRIEGDSTEFKPISNLNHLNVHSNGSLHLNSVEKDDEGTYRCNVSNSIGPSLLKDILLRVIATGESLQIQPFSFPSKSVVGKRVSISCTPASGEKMDFKWFRNSQELTKGRNMDIRSFPDLSALVIDPLTEEDTGNYTCIVNSRGLTGSYTAALEVLGENADFMVIPNPVVHPNGSLFLEFIQKEDEGSYKCNISNGIGPDLVKTVVVRVIGESLQIQPFSFPSKSVVGKRVSVGCTPASGEKMDFKWFRNSQELSKGRNVDIRSYPDLSTLVIDPLMEDDTGNYTCIVNSRGLTGSYTAALEVLVPPSWTQGPNDIDALSGDSVTLNCKGAGKPSPVVTWSHLRGETADFMVIPNPVIHPNGSLFLESIQKEDEGSYKCNISNGIGPDLVKTVVVRVIGENLQIQPFSFPSKSVIGKRGSVTCTPTSGGKMDFKWFRNGKELTKNTNVDIRSYPDLSTLIIDPLTEGDSGNYTCIVHSRGFTGSYTTNLEVLVPPSWIHFPKDFDALQGDTVVLNCKGSGNPPPTATWSRIQGENIEFSPLSSLAHPAVHLNGSLAMNSVEKEDEGTYKCNVSNGIGPPLIKTIVVRVIDRNSIKIQPFSFPSDSSIGKRVSVTCTPLMGEKMEFKWLRNGKELVTGKHNIHILSYPLLSNLVVDPLSSEDSGNYTCVVNSRGLSGSYTTTLDVLAPPSWITIPGDFDAKSGDSVILNCKGSGRPDPTVVWSKTQGEGFDFIPVQNSGESVVYSNGTFYMNAIAKEDEGMYKCNISNGIGNPLIKTVMIKVIGEDAVKIQPFSFPSEPVVGKRVSATCTPSTGEKMDFRWLKNGKELQRRQNINILSFPELSTLVINPLILEDSGNYTCVVSARGLVGSFTTTLDVLVPPSWKITPQDHDAVNGENVILTCIGLGKPEPVATWYRSFAMSNEFTPVLGSLPKNGSLIIEEIKKEDEGLYKCNVSNGIGNPLVKTVVVRVTALKIQPFSFPNDTIIGNRVITICATSNKEKNEFKWLKNGRELKSTHSTTVRSFPEFSTLIIESLVEEDAGNYTCIASSRGFTENFTTNLEVLIPVSWVVHPKDTDAVRGENVILNCQGAGKPQPTTLWTKMLDNNVEFVPVGDASGMKIFSNGSLVFENINKDDEGLYKCNISNGIGISLQQTVVVRVIVHTLNIQPFSFPNNSVLGNRVLTSCTTYNNEKMEFKWLKNGKEISGIQSANVRSFPEFSTLVIDSLSEEDAGNYTCIASSSGFTESFTATLEVLVPVSWMHQPTDVDAIRGDRVIINCKGFGKPPPAVIWSRTTESKLDFVAVAESAEINVLPNGSLKINSISKEDEGLYSCNISNGIGHVLQKTVVVRVIGVTAFKIQPFSFPKISVVGKRVTTVCATSSGGKVEFTWLKNGQDLIKNSKITVRSFPDLSNLVIDPLSEEDSGNYTCIAHSRGISEKYTTHLEVLVPPTWKAAPLDTEAIDGDTVILNCEGNGNPKPTVMWSRINGISSEISLQQNTLHRILEQNGSLILKDIDKSHEGMYKCNVSNGIGHPLIKTILVKVIESLKIQPFLFPATAMIGQRVSTMCATVTAGSKMNFQWSKNGAEIAKSNRIQVMTFPEISNIIIDPLNEDDSGNYTCIVSSNGVSDSYTASLNVLIPPSWKYKPKDEEAKNGESLFLDCHGLGKPAPSIKWFKLQGQDNDLIAIQSEKNAIIHSNGTLVINNISKESEGFYQCIVSNGVGPELKTDINIKVIDTWKIQPFTFSNARVGQRVSTTCTTSGGKRLTFEWLKDGKSVKDISNIKIISVSDVSTIIIDPVAESDSGNYTCVANSDGMTDMYIASLSVYVPPEWVNSPGDKEALSGETVIIPCSATGKPQPVISWGKFHDMDGKYHVLSESVSATDRISQLKNGSLQIDDIYKDDEGIYQCRVSNNVGMALEKSASLRVIGTPKIQPFLFPNQVISGTKTSVTCTAISGVPPMEFKWYKNGHPLKMNQKVNVRTYNDFSMIFLEEVDQSSSGNFTCELLGPTGADSYTTFLEVKEPPRWVKQPQDMALNSGINVTLECLATGHPLPNVTWKKTSDGIRETFETVQEQKQFPGKSLLEIKTASPRDGGFYKCVATNVIQSIETNGILITVSELPQIQKIMFPDQVTTGKRTSATCTAISGTPPMEFKWFRNGHQVQQNQQFTIKTSTDYSILFIDNVSLSTSGNYTCELKTPIGTDRFTAVLEVKDPPKWLKEPKDTYLLAGANLTLDCEASGFPVPIVTWKKGSNDKDIYEEVMSQRKFEGKSTLVIKEAKEEDAGLYLCTANNAISSIKTNTIVIAISGSPKIQPFNLATQFTTGEQVTLFCAIKSGTPPFSFQWMKNSQPLKEDPFAKVLDLTHFSNLLIPTITLDSRGNYTCKVSNAYGSDVHTEYLNVVVSPEWKIVPEDQERIAGESLSLECSANGFPEPIIAWKIKNQENSNEQNVIQKNSRIQILAGILTINELLEEDEGNYVCEAANGVGDGISHSVSVSVLGSPRIQPFSFPEKLTEGQKTKALCTVIEGLSPFKFMWFKNEQPLTTSSHIVIQNNDDYSVLFINSLRTEHAGNYSCAVTSSIGRDSYTSLLVVNVPPSILQDPQDQTLQEGQDALFSCPARGFPQPVVIWSRGNEKLQNERIQTFTNGSLLINKIDKSDEGLYRCTISNNIGEDLQKLVSLTVIVPAHFKGKFEVQNVRRGETATLKCEAVGDKPLSITWTKDKAEIDFKKHTRLEKFDRDVEKGLSSELIIRTADRKDGALYGCLAKNEYGTDERNIKLLVIEVPAKPIDVKLKEVWSRTASIMWYAPYTGNSPITKYIVQYWRDRGGPHRLLEETVPNSQTTVLLKNLQPGTPYAVTVLGENEIGQGQPSDILKFVTGEEEPSGPPTDVWIESKSSSSILVTWKAPPRELWNGELRGYYVGYKVDGSSPSYFFKTVDNAVNDSQEYLLTNLMKSTKYNIVVKAYNSAGTGPPSQDLVAKTLDGDVPEAPAFTVVAASESKISLRWGDPPSRNIPVTGYTLHYKKEGGEWFHIPIIASSSKNRFTITGLESSTPYKIYITASNQYGNGEASDITTVTTSMKGFVIGNTETYVDLSVIVPVAACILAFIVVAIVVIIYYRKSKARNNLERALQGGKPFPYTGSTQRYIDIDKTRLPAEPGTLTSSYATIPPQEITEEGTQEMKAFMHGNMKDRPLPSKPSSMKKKSKGHVYDTAQ